MRREIAVARLLLFDNQIRVLRGCHHPRKRMIQYSREVSDESRSRGVLDAPLSRGMTGVGWGGKVMPQNQNRRTRAGLLRRFTTNAAKPAWLTRPHFETENARGVAAETLKFEAYLTA